MGRGPVVGQAVGGGELPGAVLLLAAEHLHLLRSPPVFLPAVGTQLFKRIKLLVTLLTPGSLFQFGSLRLTITTMTNTSNFKNDEVLVPSRSLVTFQIFFSSEGRGAAITFVHNLPVTGANVGVQILLQSEHFVTSFTVKYSTN